MKSLSLSLLAFLMAFSTSIQAAAKMTPGLWEHSFTIKSESGKIEKAMAEMKKQLASMPVEQRKMMQEMLSKQGMAMGNDKTTSVKVCISKEQADNLDFPQHQNDNCKNEILKKTSHSVELKFTCEGNTKTEGLAQVTMINDKKFNSKADISITKDNKVEKMNMNTNGKWLSADCGNIKPKVSGK